ncbi:MAG: hypothetical protein K0S39_4093 [Paenibacillus sp.]|jgi:hypothetical protein|nr:hypothetical protein [Paenibacillus sp.]
MSNELEKAMAVEGCCGGPAMTNADACCIADEYEIAAGNEGCGCGTTAPEPVKKNTGSCCG